MKVLVQDPAVAKKTMADTQSEAKFQPAGVPACNRMNVEDYKRGFKVEIEPKDYFDIDSNFTPRRLST